MKEVTNKQWNKMVKTVHNLEERVEALEARIEKLKNTSKSNDDEEEAEEF